MNKLKFLFVFIQILLIGSLSGQQENDNYQLEWGPLQKGASKDQFQFIVHGDSNGVYMLRSKLTALSEQFFYLDFFSSDKWMKVKTSELVGKNTYKGTRSRFKMYFENIFYLNGKLVLFLSSYDHEKNKHFAFAQYLNDAGEPIGELKEIAEINAERKSNRGSFYFKSSPNSNYILLVSHNPVSQKYNNEKLEFCLLDSGIHQIWNQTFTLPYKDQDFFPLEFIVDDNGNVLMLSKVYLSKEDQKDKNLDKSEYYYTLLQFTKDEHDDIEYKETIFQLKDKYIVNMMLNVDKESNIKVAGYYSNKKDLNTIIGVYSFSFPFGTDNLGKIKLYELEEGFIPDFITETPMKFGEEGEPELQLTHYYFYEDGSSLLVGEHVLFSEVCFTDIRTALTTCNYSYYFNDIFLVKMDPDGNVKWKIRIPKRQLTRNDYGAYSSFALGVIDDKVILTYNENPKNFKIKSSNAYSFMSDPGRSTVVLIEIDKNGHVKKNELFSNFKKRAWYKPSLNYQIDNNSMIMFNQKLRIYQIGKIHYK